MADDTCSLTGLVKAGGCGSKLGADELRAALAGIPKQSHPNVPFGTSAGDDAGVYILRDDLAIIQTVDFFTPIVDDPYDFGCIAAANALSDCYALGANPITVLNLLCFPRDRGTDEVKEILRGAADTTSRSGAVVLGGHSINDVEPKFGLSVTGAQHPKKLVLNNGAKPGDVLILTKKIGVGILSSATRKSISCSGWPEAVESMKTLNNIASHVMFDYGIRAATDVTGFGLLGHARNVAEASSMSFEIDSEKVRLFTGVREIATSFAGGGAERNWKWVKDVVDMPDHISGDIRVCLCDPQTSGPLLLAVPADKVDSFLAKIADQGVTEAHQIGRVIEKNSKVIFVR